MKIRSSQNEIKMYRICTSIICCGSCEMVSGAPGGQFGLTPVKTEIRCSCDGTDLTVDVDLSMPLFLLQVLHTGVVHESSVVDEDVYRPQGALRVSQHVLHL